MVSVLMFVEEECVCDRSRRWRLTENGIKGVVRDSSELRMLACWIEGLGRTERLTTILALSVVIASAHGLECLVLVVRWRLPEAKVADEGRYAVGIER